jgi:hypothetical protein
MVGKARDVMSFAILALGVLGCDLLLYGFFIWIYPERGRKSARSRKTAEHMAAHFAPHTPARLR